MSEYLHPRWEGAPSGWLGGNQPAPTGQLYARYIPAANGPDPTVLGNFPSVVECGRCLWEIAY